MSILYREPSIDTSYQVSVHLAKRFQRRRFFRNQPIRNKNGLWWPYLLTDQELCQMNRHLVGSIYGRFSIKNAHFVPIHLQTWPPQAILVSDWSISKKSSTLKQLGQMVSYHLVKRFQRKSCFRNRPIRKKNCL
jgi:hypothetical protein